MPCCRVGNPRNGSPCATARQRSSTIQLLPSLGFATSTPMPMGSRPSTTWRMGGSSISDSSRADHACTPAGFAVSGSGAACCGAASGSVRLLM